MVDEWFVYLGVNVEEREWMVRVEEGYALVMISRA